MPKKLERKLKQVADSYAKSGKLKKKTNEKLTEAKNRFVYGLMRKKSGRNA